MSGEWGDDIVVEGSFAIFGYVKWFTFKMVLS